MKMTRKLLSLVLSLVIVVSFAIPAFATAIPKGYAPMTKSTTQNGATLTSRVTVGENNDSAKLRIKQEVQSGSYKYAVKSGESSRGALTYSYTQILYHIMDYPPKTVYVTYEVYAGTTYDAYACYGTYSLDSSVI